MPEKPLAVAAGGPTFRKVLVRTFLHKLYQEVADDNIADMAAMMTYYAIFALVPMAVFVLSLALLVIPPDAIREAVHMATATMPRDLAWRVSQQVLEMQRATAGSFAVASILLALFGASRGAVALGRVLNGVYDQLETRPWWRVQLVSIAVTIGVAILLVIALGLLVVGPALGHLLADRFGLGSAFDHAWHLGRWLGAALLILLIWAILYKYLPDTAAPLRVFTPGALAGVSLWILVSELFALYTTNFGRYDQTYGALGAAVIFLTWLWLSNMALLVGAEIDSVIADLRSASRAPRTPSASPFAPGGRSPA